MKPQNPGAITDSLLQHKSVYKVLRANVSIGQVETYDATGVPATFIQDNGDGILIRVGTHANPHGLANAWTGNNTDTIVTHNLGRVPIGYYVTKKTVSCDVYDGTVLPDESTIVLKNTAGLTADTVLYIF